MVYSEGQINGYRWYDQHGVVPAFPFGFGLSYGSFEYSAIQIDRRTVSFTVTRSGGDEGCDTPQVDGPSRVTRPCTTCMWPTHHLHHHTYCLQVYLSFPGAASDPATPNKVLRFFQKTCKASTLVSYTFTDRDLSRWDVANKKWQVVKGTFGVTIAPAAQGGAVLTGALTSA